MVELNFDANTVEPQGTYELIDAGWYRAYISASEQKPTKSGNGSYVSLRFTLLDEGVAGRTLFTNLNLQNPNEKAVEIAYKQLSSICHATGVIQVSDTAELHDKPLQIKVKVRSAQGQYDAQNEINGFKSIDGSAPVVATAPSSDGDDAPPWME